MRLALDLLRSRCGATAAEFAMVLPLLLIAIFAIIDMGRLIWTVNQGQKAVQVGARHAVVTDLVAAGLQDYSFVSAINPPGSPVTDLFGSITCEAAGGTPACTCTTQPCSDEMLGETNTTSFERIVARVRNFYPMATDANVKIIYDGVGLGYAGNPHGSDVSPMVTLELAGVTFTPVTLMVFGSPQIPLPPFRSSLTLEDGTGTISN